MSGPEFESARRCAAPTTCDVLEAARALLEGGVPPSASDFDRTVTDCAAGILAIELEMLRTQLRLDQHAASPAAAPAAQAANLRARREQLDDERAQLRAVIRELRELRARRH